MHVASSADSGTLPPKQALPRSASPTRARRLPAICIDENLSPQIAGVFRDIGFRVIEIAKHPRLRGEDERAFIGELYRDNTVFVTGDLEFVNELADHRRRHAGAVYIPQDLPGDDKAWVAFAAAYAIIGRCTEDRHAFRGLIFYVANDGLRIVDRGNDRLQLSWASFHDLVSAVPTQRSPRRRRHRH
jgi:hypothetical protein